MSSLRLLSSSLRVLTCIALLLLLCCTGLQAQNSRGTILGHVVDSTGGSVVGAKITLRNVDTGIANEFSTNSAGDYVFVNINPGRYELKVEATGFKAARTTSSMLARSPRPSRSAPTRRWCRPTTPPSATSSTSA
jgi:hypothetical protein